MSLISKPQLKTEILERYPAGDAQVHIADIRSKLANVTYIALSIYCIPAFAVSLYGIFEADRFTWSILGNINYVFVYFLCGITLLRKSVPYFVRISYLLFFFLFFGISSLYNAGVVSAGPFFFAFGGILAASLGGTRIVWCYFGFVVVATLVIAFLVSNGYLVKSYPQEAEGYYRSALAWMRLTVGLSGFLAIIIIITRFFYNNLSRTIYALSDLNEALKQSNIEIKDSEKRFKTISDYANYGSAIADMDGNLLYVNDSALRMHGYDREEVIGNNLLMFHSEEQFETVKQLVAQAIERGGFIAEEVWHTRKDGSVFLSQMNGHVIYDHTGNPMYMSGTVIDITERKAAEEAIANYQKKLKALNLEITHIRDRERRDIASELHENIGQLLSMAFMDIQQLEQKIEPSESEGAVSKAAAYTEQAIEYVRSLSRKLDNPILHDLGLCRTLEQELETFESENEISTVLECDAETVIPDKEVQHMLYHVARELLANIAKHARAECVTISLRCQEGQVRLSVADDGIGFQYKDENLNSLRGGFGLFNIREQIESFGGTISIHSTPEDGSRIEITIPVGGEAT